MDRLQQRSRSSARGRRREPQWKVQAMFAALLASVSLCAAGAKQEQQSFSMEDPTLQVQPADKANSSGDVPSAVIIQGEEPRPDDSMQRLRDTLRPPAVTSERRLADGSVEAVTRFGRFCVKPLPPYLQPRIGGEVTLAARCTPL